MSDSVPIPPYLMDGDYDVREMSFQNVIDRILRPSGIKMGGFPVEMFIGLTEAEQQKFMCNICYNIANECRCCDNKHVFCQSCILAWSMTFGENSQKCPFCRCNQTEYHVHKELDDELKDRRVSCLTDGCSYKAPLRFFLLHSHGRTDYSNADVDFGRIQSEQRRFFPPLPSLSAIGADNVATGVMDIREQLLQGRMMIHQMMLLMHLEMQLRQQALASYQEAQDPAQRMQRLDDVMSLNEQLNEVGSILGMLLNAPLDHGASFRFAASTAFPPSGHHGPSTVGGRFGAPATGESVMGPLLQTFRFRVLDPDSDDDDTTDDSASYSASIFADADNSDVLDEDFGQAGSSGTSVSNSYDFDIASRHRQYGSTAAYNSNAERAPLRSTVSTNVDNATSHPVVRGSGTNRQRVAASMMPPSSTSVGSNGLLSAVLSRRRHQHTTPRWMTVEQTPVSVTVTELNLPAGVRSQVGVGTTPPQTVTLPEIQSSARGVADASQMPLMQNGDDSHLAMVGRQMNVSDSSGRTPRQLQPQSRNRSYGMSSAARGTTLVGRRNSQQMLPTSDRVAREVTSTTGGASSSSGVNAYNLLDSAPDSRQSSSDGSSVLTEPWPVLPVTRQHISTSNRSVIAQPATRRDELQLSHVRGSLARNGATAATHSPRTAVQEMHGNRPLLHLRRSSVRNTHGRPAGPTSVSTLRPSASHSPHVVPLPHPPVRGARQQGGHSTAGSNASNNIVRPRRRSEIARDLMFPPREDSV